MMTVHPSEKEEESFHSFLLGSLLFFSLLSRIMWKGFLPTLLHLLNNQLFISFQNKVCQALINTFLSATITYHIFIAQLIVFH